MVCKATGCQIITLYLQMVQLIEVFKIIKDGNLCEEASVEGITNFNFVCMLYMYTRIRIKNRLRQLYINILSIL